MTDAHAAAVEAAAHAAVGYIRDNVFQAEPYRSVAMTEAAIAAYLATMAEAARVMVRDVADMIPDYEGYVDERWADGWNACRAAMLGGGGDGQG